MIRNPDPSWMSSERRHRYARRMRSLSTGSWATRARTRSVGDHEHFAGFHHFGGVERGLAFEVAQLPEEPPGAVHPDHVPVARVVCRC